MHDVPGHLSRERARSLRRRDPALRNYANHRLPTEDNAFATSDFLRCYIKRHAATVDEYLRKKGPIAHRTHLDL